jgi:hypothetical protein
MATICRLMVEDPGNADRLKRYVCWARVETFSCCAVVAAKPLCSTASPQSSPASPCSAETRLFVLRVMIGAIVLYDHVHPVGAFSKANKTIDVGPVASGAPRRVCL